MLKQTTDRKLRNVKGKNKINAVHIRGPLKIRQFLVITAVEP